MNKDQKVWVEEYQIEMGRKTKVLVEKPLKEVIQELMPSEEEMEAECDEKYDGIHWKPQYTLQGMKDLKSKLIGE